MATGLGVAAWSRRERGQADISLHGVLVDALDRPIANALLEFAAASPQRGTVLRQWKVKTGRDGRFALHDLETGRYAITILSSDDELVQSTVHVTSDDAPVRLMVRPGLIGRVVSDSGAPVDGALIVAETLDGEEAFGCTHSADDGRFAITVPPRLTSFRLLVSHDAYAERYVTVAHTKDVDVVLNAGRRIAGVVADRSGAAVSGATIILKRREFVRLVKSAADGSFVAGGLSDGMYELTVQSPGLIPSEPLRVAAGSKDVCLRVDRGETISGRVRFEEHGSGLVWVEALDHSGEPLVAVTVKRDGRFELKGLPSGSYAIHAYRESSVIAGSEITVENVFTGTADLEIRLPE